MYRRMSRKTVSGTNSTLEDQSSEKDILEEPLILHPQSSKILINTEGRPP